MSDQFVSAGYGAENELDPTAWREYMLADLDRKDKNMQTRLQDYLHKKAQRKAADDQAARKRQMQWSLGLAGSFLGGPVGGAIGSVVGGLFGGKKKKKTVDIPEETFGVDSFDNFFAG